MTLFTETVYKIHTETPIETSAILCEEENTFSRGVEIRDGIIGVSKL